MTPFIRYITSWYTDPDQARYTEQVEAVRRQAGDPLVASHAVLAMDEGCPIESVPIDHRPTFRELIVCGGEGMVNLLLNTDCYVEPETTAMLETIERGEVWCISRQDMCNSTSQDAWAWRGGLALPPDAGLYAQGILGCDNRFAFDCAAAGFDLRNPALTILVRHLHASGVRRWTQRERLPRPYLFIAPGHLHDPPRFEFQGADLDKARLPALMEGC